MLGEHLHRIWITTEARAAVQKVPKEVMLPFTRFDFDSSDPKSKLRNFAVCIQEKGTDLESNPREVSD